jgi:hypothetical protein
MLKKAHEILAYQALSRYVRGHLNGSSRDYHLPTIIKLISTKITLIGTEHKAQKLYFVKFKRVPLQSTSNANVTPPFA